LRRPTGAPVSRAKAAVGRLEAMRNDLMAKAVELDTTRQKANKKSKDASGA